MTTDRLADLSEMDRQHAEAELRAEVERLRTYEELWRIENSLNAEILTARDQAREERDHLAAIVDRVAAIVEPPHIATLENLSEVIDCARAAIEGTDS